VTRYKRIPLPPRGPPGASLMINVTLAEKYVAGANRCVAGPLHA